MNGTEQRERATAVARVEKRLEDLEAVVVDGLAKGIVEDRAKLDEELLEIRRTAQTRHDWTRDTMKALDDRVIAFEEQTLWQRLRWLIRGRA